MPKYTIQLVPLQKIKVTEEHSSSYAEVLRAEISLSGIWSHPLWVDDKRFALMDGHHRFFAAKKLGLELIPAILIDYEDPAVAIESWRPGHKFTYQELWEVAASGTLLPMKTTRHVVSARLPNCQVPLEWLESTERAGESVAPADPTASRIEILTDYYFSFCARMNMSPLSGTHPQFPSIEQIVPHAQLRLQLISDPAMAALLPGALCKIALGKREDFPFRLKAHDLLLLPSGLLECPPALAAIARWGMEAAFALQTSKVGYRRLASLVRHGASLVRMLCSDSRAFLLELDQRHCFKELIGSSLESPSMELLEWFSALVGLELEHPESGDAVVAALPLEGPIEEILISNGDSRLQVDPETGKNRYGTTPRPRPEAVHFSSSTASSVSDYGFFFCEILRRDLLNHYTRELIEPGVASAKLSDAVVHEMRSLCKLQTGEADGIVAPSGTDTEMLAVLMGRAGAPRDRLTNIIVSPEETGRGVKLAGSGRYFDSMTATGTAVDKGSQVWPDMAPEVIEIPLRDATGAPLSVEELDERFLAAGKRALESGSRVLAHLLVGSKTGLSGPSENAIESFAALALGSVDIVVDACQMRSSFEWLGNCVKRGWMVQISGSKALTGPPFSGGLLIPIGMRERVRGVRELLKSEICRNEDWSAWWYSNLGRSDCQVMFGAAFRWLPALMEAKLLDYVPNPLRIRLVARFREEVRSRLDQSKCFSVLESELVGVSTELELNDNPLSQQSIVSFQVFGTSWNGAQIKLNEQECRKLFEYLNQDARSLIPSASRAEQFLLRQEFQIGQPVSLGTGDNKRVILRLVIGYRFFNIVANGGQGGRAESLESELSDLFRAIDKLEILATNWWSYGEIH